MTAPVDWRKSSHSGSGDGNACVEIAELGPRIAVRDSKHPVHGPLAFSAPAFSAFVAALKIHPTGPGGVPGPGE
ncbi:hypothetical protein SUDANB58_02031 [Streptomyces sp. enrichment culture]|uniref:DUF397 domain-containing protein n=1 Tax=Streptomyces sp. enrichment culture TaxID=1795815 RepID=UPI003F554BF4